VKKKIQIRFISSQDQLVDVFTKPLPTTFFTVFQFKLRVDPPPQLEGTYIYICVQGRRQGEAGRVPGPARKFFFQPLLSSFLVFL